VTGSGRLLSKLLCSLSLVEEVPDVVCELAEAALGLPLLGHIGGVEDSADVGQHVLMFGVHQVGVVPGVGPALAVDQELLKVPRDVAHPHWLVEKAVGLGELGEGGPASSLHVGIDREFVLPVNFGLLEEVVELRVEVAPWSHPSDTIHQLLRGGVRLLHAELVAGVAQHDEFRELFFECIYLYVGYRGQPSVGRHVEN